MPKITKPAGRAGRRPSTSADRIGAVGIKLFTEQGFEKTSVDEIAETAGIARRTFFRYFPSKNAVPWGDFEGHLERMRAGLDGLPDDITPAEGLRRVLIRFNTFPDEEAVTHRRRMALILGEQPLQAYSMLMYTDWRHAIAEYVARRTGMRADDHVPQSVAWTLLGVALSAYEKWLDGAGGDLVGSHGSGSGARLHALLDEGMTVLEQGLGSLPVARGTAVTDIAADVTPRRIGSAYTTR
ncbi:mycofactocin system transcriptional regulator [Tomitella fengzijianii]|uniref:Mycofactocin system transcriptional regulator n=1 Tax=Tomitella fengzijianii TaxID=2597660 RepID=A0A516X1H1_9ACTN|nr:mycofactocin system transcriptional regulator [Tomitella fengzijianii]QDQ96932.1 mycofactocin system transcriptional regulator [Tomitella fengzijianii]